MIKNIIFDIGEVLLGYRWNYVLEQSGLSAAEGIRVGNLIFDDPIWNELDAGNLSFAEAKRSYIEKYPADEKALLFFLDHPEMMPLAREDIWAYLPKLKAAGYRLYLLSNYSEELFAVHTKDRPFFAYMDGGVISYQIHVCKPDPKIYEALLAKYGLNPRECVFFDDRIENVDGAIAVGIAAVHVKKKEVLMQELERLLDEKADA